MSFLFDIPLVFWNLLCLSAFHVGLWRILLARLRASRHHQIDPEEIGFALPRVAVVLPLNRLERQEVRSLRALLSQDHPAYQIRIVVGPRATFDMLRLHHILSDYPLRSVTCVSLDIHRSLLVSVKGNQTLSSDYLATAAFSQEVQTCQQATSPPVIFALMSSQLVPHSSWLRELVAPITCRGATATTSYPWHFSFLSWRSGLNHLEVMAQYAWNAIAVIQMVCAPQRMLWNGSMALESRYLAQRLRSDNALLLSDTALSTQLLKDRQLIHWVSNLMNVRCSPLAPKDFTDEIGRRLNAFKRYRIWILLAAQGFFVSFTNLRCFSILIWSLSTRDTWTFLWTLSGFLFYLFVLLLLVETMEKFVVLGDKGIRQPSSLRANQVFHYSFKVLLMPVLQLAHVSHALTILKTMFERNMTVKPHLDKWVNHSQPSDAESSVMS